MSKLITFVIASILVSQAFAQSPAQQAEALNVKGKAAENAGDPTGAKDFYSSALKLDPKNATAIYSLGQLKINSGAIAAKGREAKIGAVMIPAFQLDQATLKEALDALSAMIEKESKDTVTPNFVLQDPKNRLADQKLSVNLKNIPAKGVIKYLTEQTSTKVRYDEHAVVVVAR
jgi:tetratricopeptide (TPR) repeat protein